MSRELNLEFAEAPQGPVGNSCSLFLSPIPGQMLEQCQGLMWGRERSERGTMGGSIAARAWESGVIYWLHHLLPVQKCPSAGRGGFLRFWRNLSSKGFESWQLLIIPCQGHLFFPCPSWPRQLGGGEPWDRVTSMGTMCPVHEDVKRLFSPW